MWVPMTVKIMVSNDETYKRLARHFDGLDVELNDTEQALAEEIRLQEQTLVGLDVPLPAGADQRARRRMFAALARPSRRRGWLRFVVTAEAAAVAAVLLVAVTLTVVSTDRYYDEPCSVPTSVLAQAADPAGQSDLDSLAEQLDQLEAETITSITFISEQTDSTELDSLERDVHDFLLEDTEDAWNSFL